jgi:hypothetical protein
LPADDDLRVVRYLRDLADEPLLPVGTRVVIRENEWVFHRVGNTRPEIASRLKWGQKNVWVPAPALQHIVTTHPEIREPIAGMAFGLNHLLTASEVPDKSEVRFLIDAKDMRSEGYLVSRSVNFVDLLVKLWSDNGEIVLRGFHLAPTRRVSRGQQRWP